ncbi:MAG: BTAD domain-containing putative transcriptional regulator, partial [Micromonosporaceae bacterium]
MLGPLEVWDGQAWLPVRASKQRTLLAVLLLHPDQPMDRDWLIDTLWGGTPPASAARLLPHYVWRLRAMLGDGDQQPLRAVPNGYALSVAPDETDRGRFDALVADARAATDPSYAIDQLDAGLALWRGPALADTRTVPLLEAAAHRWEQSRVEAAEALAELRIDHGSSEQVLSMLHELTRSAPYQDKPWRLLMLALHRAGRRPDALATYQRMWRVWNDELGIEPSQQVRELHHQLLTDSPSLTVPAPDAATESEPAQRPEAPAQLPPDLADFTGRDGSVRHLVDTLGAVPAPGVVPGVVVYGQGGVGKTALAVRAGHLLRAEFGGGQLFVNLRGGQPQPTPPDRVLAQFLRALGVPATQVPESLDERARLFRSRAADRRILVVLDDAADEAQVRPLLPTAGAVLVTSRRPLAGLEGFTRRQLDVLDPEAATTLLGRIAGPDRVRAEAAAAEQIVRLCGTLPLAVRTAGARLSAKPHWPLSRLAVRLADEHRRLDELRAGDLEVRASLALSYAGLDADEREALRTAAMAPVPDFAGWLVAAGCDVDEAEAENLVERLVDAQLLEPAGVDGAGQPRYRLHDLTRVFAAERARAEDTPAHREAVLTRWLRAGTTLTAYAVGRTGDRVRGFDPPPVDLAATGAAIAEDPYAWYAAESATLLALIESGCGHRLATPAWQLAHALATFFEIRGGWDDWRRSHQLASEAAAAADDRIGVAAMRSGLGRLALDHGENPEALRLLEPAAETVRALGPTPLLAVTLHRLGEAYGFSGRLTEAIASHTEALRLAEDTGDRSLQMDVLRSLGLLQHLTGELSAAADSLVRALALADAAHLADPDAADTAATPEPADGAEPVGAVDRTWLKPWILASLGSVRLELGQPGDAAHSYRQAKQIAERRGDQRGVIHAMRGLGEAYRQAGNPGAAVGVLREALALARELGEDLGQAQALRRLGAAYSELGRH